MVSNSSLFGHGGVRLCVVCFFAVVCRVLRGGRAVVPLGGSQMASLSIVC